LPETLQSFVSRVKDAVDARLPVLLAGPGGPEDLSSLDALPGAAREALLSPGKRVRPALVYLAGELFGGPRERLLNPACAIEMVHAASLALDDLPAMDDATSRRGRPALHVSYGEDLAILAAVTLLSRAFGVLAESALTAARRELLPPSTALDLVSRLSDACGLHGLASGQALDLASDERDLSFDLLETIHARKTGALFVASAEFGAVLSGAREKELSLVRSYAKNVGLAFQIVDDLLETAPTEDTGKESHRTSAPTFTRHVGAEAARHLVDELTRHAVEAIALFGEKGALLVDFARQLADRTA
jgi:geranylgeranyl pyrophosphate synthase